MVDGLVGLDLTQNTRKAAATTYTSDLPDLSRDSLTSVRRRGDNTRRMLPWLAPCIPGGAGVCMAFLMVTCLPRPCRGKA